MLTAFVIDDDVDDQEIFSLVMKEISDTIKCVFANDGLSALNHVKNVSTLEPNLIFIDMNMPRMNGVQCLEELRKISKLQTVPVYIYSTHIDRIMVEQCEKFGASGFIQKPVDIKDLKTDLKKIISYLKAS